MTAYSCELQSYYFYQVVQGLKSVEGRLNKDKWSNMKSGDILYIRNAEMSDVVVGFRILHVEYADSFYTLHRIYGKKLLPNLDEKDHDGAANVYSKIYTDNLVKYYGVVGLVLEKLE